MSRWRLIHGKTHSHSADDAELRGELPILRAVEKVYETLDCKRRKISRKKVRAFLELHCGRGWHHVAGPSHAQNVDYFATELTDEQKAILLGESPDNRGDAR